MQCTYAQYFSRGTGWSSSSLREMKQCSRVDHAVSTVTCCPRVEVHPRFREHKRFPAMSVKYVTSTCTCHSVRASTTRVVPRADPVGTCELQNLAYSGPGCGLLAIMQAIVYAKLTRFQIQSVLLYEGLDCGTGSGHWYLARSALAFVSGPLQQQDAMRFRSF